MDTLAGPSTRTRKALQALPLVFVRRLELAVLRELERALVIELETLAMPVYGTEPEDPNNLNLST